jgi:hypothetical protein
MESPITAEAWNELVLELWRKLQPNVMVLDAGGWRHPWNVQGTYDSDAECWVANIKPGFVYGYSPTVSMPEADGLPSRAVPLTKSPSWPIKTFRSIGPDATPSGATTSADGGGTTLNYEEVPLFFQVRGVGPPPKAKGNLESGLSVENEAEPNSRLLRACELVLDQPRIKTAAQQTVSPASDSTVYQFTVGYEAPKSSIPRISQRSKYAPAPADDPLARLLGSWADTGKDELHLSTIYMLSPEGAAYGSEPDATWTPYVHHRVFWNLAHATRAFIRAIKSDNLTLNTGLAGSVGDTVNQYLLSQVNDATSAVAQFLGNNTMEGKFWTV